MAAKKRRRSKRQQSVPGWAYMLFGLSIGLAVALVVYLRTDPGAVPPERLTANRPQASAAPDAPADGRDGTAATNRSSTAAANATPAASTARAGTDAGEADSDEEEYSFFRALPESEVVIPESEFRAREAAGPPPEYIIQAGSFRSYAEADGVQARLAFLGIESRIESAIVGNQLWHRVIIGPLSEREQINGTVRRLNAARIDSMPPRQVSR